MIDWMNPSEDVLEAKCVGYEEGRESRDEEVVELNGEVENWKGAAESYEKLYADERDRVSDLRMVIEAQKLLTCDTEYCLKRPIVPGEPSLVEQAKTGVRQEIIQGLRLKREEGGAVFVVDCPLCTTSFDARIGEKRGCPGCEKAFTLTMVKDCDDNVIGVSLGWQGEEPSIVPDDGIRGRNVSGAMLDDAGYSEETYRKYAKDKLNPDYYGETALHITETEEAVQIESGEVEMSHCITGDCGECIRCKQVAEYKDIKTIRERHAALVGELEQAKEWVCRLIRRSNPGLMSIKYSVGEAAVTACEQRLNYVHEQWKEERLKRRQLEREQGFLKSERDQMREALDLVAEEIAREDDDLVVEDIRADMRTDARRRAGIKVAMHEGEEVSAGDVEDILHDLDLSIRAARAYATKLADRLFQVDAKSGRTTMIQCERCADGMGIAAHLVEFMREPWRDDEEMMDAIGAQFGVSKPEHVAEKCPVCGVVACDHKHHILQLVERIRFYHRIEEFQKMGEAMDGVGQGDEENRNG